MTSAKHTWQTLWLIVGPRMVGSETRLRDNISLAPLPEDVFVRFKQETVPAPNLSASSDAFVVHYPPRDVVQSRHRVQVDIRTHDQNSAIDAAAKVVDRLLVSLSLAVPGGRFFAELRKVRRSDQREEYSAWSQSVGILPMSPPAPFLEGDLDRTLFLFDAVDRDETAENAYVHLLTAWQLKDTAGSKPLQRSILQHYVLAIEAVVNGVIKRVRTLASDRIRIAEREFAAKFAEEFGRAANKPKAIRDASTALREISLINMLPSIDEASRLLGIADNVRDRAKELYQFRSRSLSHPGRVKKGDIDKWLLTDGTIAQASLADSTARSFITRYCEYLSEKAQKAD